MPGPLEHLPTTESAVARLDPRWKLAAVLLAAAGVLALRSLPAAGLALLAGTFLAVLARLPMRWALTRLALVVLVLAPFLLLLPFVHPDPDRFHLGPLPISGAGAVAAARLAFKTLSIVLLMLILLVSSPLPATLKAARSLGMPDLMVQLAALTYRYVFVLAGELARIRVALQVRGYRNRANLHSYRTVGHVAGTLLVRGYEQAGRVEQAMRCRGFDGTYRTMDEFRTRPGDVVGFLLLAGTAAVVLLIDLVFVTRTNM
jgi:cobalt/nickel transport system permease protein